MRAFLHLYCALLSILFASPVYAQELEFSALMRMLATVTSSKVSFTERKTSPLLGAPLVLTGNLAYVKPDRLEKDVLSPYEERTIIVGDRVTIENRALKQQRTFSLSSSPTVSALIGSVRATLAGDAAVLERHYRIQLDGSQASWLMTLLPRDETLAGLVSRIRIAGERQRLTRIEIEESSGDSSVMLIGSEVP